MCSEACLLLVLEPIRLTFSVSHGYPVSRRAVGRLWTASHCRATRPSGFSKGSREGPSLLEPALLGLPPVATAWLHTPTFLSFPSLRLA